MELLKNQKEQIQTFKEILLEKNKSINLFSRKNPSLQLNILLEQGLITGGLMKTVLNSPASPILDIGSGNGFPGLLFAILYPRQSFILCESSRKKSEFLKYVLSSAKISNAEVLCQRAEDIEKRFTKILSQAAISLEKILNVLDKVLTPKGEAFLWQSSSWKDHWPETKRFRSELFKLYQIQGSEKALVRVKKL